MARYFFSLGLVPVQSWIAEARRSRDLKAGSVFLWHVMAGLLAELEERSGTVIHLPRAQDRSFADLAALPFEQALEEPYGLPNRASGEVEAADDGELRRLFQGLEERVRQRWQALRERVLAEGELKGEIREYLREPLAAYLDATAGGADCPLSLVWVATPATAGAEPREGLEQVDRLYAQAKRTRPQRPWTLGQPVGKCNQCSHREAMGPTARGFDNWRDWYGRLAELPQVQRGVRLDPGERLCYVCLARRLAAYLREDDRPPRAFASTGEVAAGPWLRAVRAVEELRPHLEALERTNLGELDLGRALYLPEERLAALGGEEVIPPRQRLQEAIRRHNRRSQEGESPRRPLPLRPPGYLALLTFDGDGMGRAVHRDLEGIPDKMAAFARAAKEILEEQSGEIFYLGGDEGLAMVPAAPALAVAQALRARFQELFDDTPTLSVGLAFFEHSRPMAGAIRAAREALDKAKAREGKNALGVAVETASGNRWGFAEPWGTEWERIGEAVRMVQEGTLAGGWAYDAESFLQSLAPGGWRESGFRAAVRAELERLLRRRILRKEEKAGAWSRLQGESWWEGEERDDWNGETGPPTEPFRLMGFLARQAARSPAPSAAKEEAGA